MSQLESESCRWRAGLSLGVMVFPGCPGSTCWQGTAATQAPCSPHHADPTELYFAVDPPSRLPGSEPEGAAGCRIRTQAWGLITLRWEGGPEHECGERGDTRPPPAVMSPCRAAGREGTRSWVWTETGLDNGNDRT